MSNWIDVKDRLPERTGPWPVCVTFTNQGVTEAGLAEYLDAGTWCLVNDSYFNPWAAYKVTHWIDWLPLPEEEPQP